MTKIIATKNGQSVEYSRRCDCANAHGMGVDVLNRLIKTGHSRDGWYYDVLYSADAGDGCGLKAFDADNVPMNLVRIAKKKHVPFKDIARACNVTEQSIERWFSGKTAIKHDILLKIATVIEIDSIDDLFMSEE